MYTKSGQLIYFKYFMYTKSGQLIYFKYLCTVRVYTESGQLIVQKCFHPAPVRHIKFQSMPEGKHCSNILFTQTMQGMQCYRTVTLLLKVCTPLTFYFKNFIEDSVVFCHKKDKFCPFSFFSLCYKTASNFSREIVFDNYQFSGRKQE